MKSNYKLPGLPSVESIPASTTKTTPARSPGISKMGGFNSGTAQPVNFGRASRAATRNPASASGSTFSNLVSATVSGGGVGGALSSTLGFGLGIGSLISGLTSLFGGGKTAPPALIAYQLPTSQEQTISTGSSVSTPGVYGGPSASTPFENQSRQIVQSVKQALLNSSSLNDVIAEL